MDGWMDEWRKEWLMTKSMTRKEAFTKSDSSFSSFLRQHGVRAKTARSPERHTSPEILMNHPQPREYSHLSIPSHILEKSLSGRTAITRGTVSHSPGNWQGGGRTTDLSYTKVCCFLFLDKVVYWPPLKELPSKPTSGVDQSAHTLCRQY